MNFHSKLIILIYAFLLPKCPVLRVAFTHFCRQIHQCQDWNTMGNFGSVQVVSVISFHRKRHFLMPELGPFW